MFMNTQHKKLKRIMSLVMAIAMTLTLGVSALASEVQPYNADVADVMGSVNYTAQTYTVTVTAAADAAKVNVSATLYQKNLIGRTEIDSFTASANGRKCTKSKSATIEKGKTYQIEVTAEIYSGGQWYTVENTITAKT